MPRLIYLPLFHIVKNAEEEIRQLKRKLENFDRYASTGNLQQVQHQSVALSPMTSAGPSCGHSLGGSLTNMTKVGGGSAGVCGSGQPTCAGGIDRPIFDKDFECSVCLDDMRPPIKIFQCRNGHVMCESCKNHPEVVTCPTCRIPLPGIYLFTIRQLFVYFFVYKLSTFCLLDIICLHLNFY